MGRPYSSRPGYCGYYRHAATTATCYSSTCDRTRRWDSHGGATPLPVHERVFDESYLCFDECHPAPYPNSYYYYADAASAMNGAYCYSPTNCITTPTYAPPSSSRGATGRKGSSSSSSS
eukprot:Filipodium_phascolosomae@DN3289_c1_g1_i1.p1